jgi:hypothetical protein
MADPNLAAIFAGLDPLSAQILQGQQGAQLGAAALDPAFGHNEGIAGALAKTIAAFSGHDMMNQAVQNTTQARIAAQPGIAQLMANPNPYGELAQNPQNYSPLVRAAFLAGGPEQAQKYQLQQQLTNEAAIKNIAGLNQLRQQAAAFGQPMPTAGNLPTYQGIDWTKIFSGGAGAPGGVPSGAVPSGAMPGGVPDVGGLWGRMKGQEHGVGPNGEALVSPKGAIGVSQILSSTAQATAKAIGVPYDESRLYTDQPYNEMLGRAYLGQQLDKYQNNPVLAAAAYNAGPGRVDSWRKTIGDPLTGEISNDQFAQRIPVDETREYVQSVTGAGRPTQLAQAGGAVSGTDATGGAIPGAPPGAPSAAGPPSVLDASGMNAVRQQALMSAYGVKISEPVQDYLQAQVLPPGPGRELARAAAYSKAGIKQFIGGERRGSPIFKLDPQSWTYNLAVQNPQLPEGAIENPTTGEISMASGALPAIAGVEKAKAGAEAEAKAPYEEPIQIHGPQGENWLLPRALAPMLPYLAQAGVRVGTPPGAAAPGAGPAAPGAPPGGPAPPTGAPPIPPVGTPPLAPPGAPPVSGGLMRGGAVPGPQVPGVPPPPLAPGARPPTPGSTMAAPPMPVAAAGGKDISQLTLDDLFPGGQGISQRPQPPPGALPGALTEAEKDVQKRDVERLSEYQNQTIPNQEIYRDAGHIMDTLAEGLHTSNLTPLTYRLTNMMQGFGLDPQAILGKGYNPADTAVFDKAATNLVSAFVRRFAGQIRVAEFGIGERANPGLTMPIQANYSIINDVIARSRWQDAFTDLATKYSTETGHAPLNTFEHRFAQVAPLPQYTDASKAALRQMGAKFPEDTGTRQGTPEISIGQTIRNPTTGERRRWDGKQWVPM